MKPPSFGFPRQYRLDRPSEFQRVLRDASLRSTEGPLRLHAVANTMPSARLGLIVAKRHVPRAVARNRIKRVVRESFRLRRDALPRFDIVIQVGQKTEQGAPIREHVERLWSELMDSVG